MPKHTAGPWRVRDAGRSGNVIRFEVYSPGGHIRGIDDPAQITASEALANARLIAAAPDLLESLRRCVSALDGLLGDSDQIPDDNRPGVLAMQSARAAIEKVEGR